MSNKKISPKKGGETRKKGINESTLPKYQAPPPPPPKKKDNS